MLNEWEDPSKFSQKQLVKCVERLFTERLQGKIAQDTLESRITPIKLRLQKIEGKGDNALFIHELGLSHKEITDKIL